MESFKIENLSFRYPSEEKLALDSVSINVNKGEFLTVCGTSGCGKTTLLRLLDPILSPNGEKTGRILFEDKNLNDAEKPEIVKKIGFVMQNPDNQLVTDKVWHELAFGPESLGMENNEIRARVAEMASFFGIEDWFYKNVDELSGGQKQLLNLASVMVMAPSVLILDEPTSQLDPIAAQGFLSAVSKINREIGTTVIMSEHRLEEAFSVSDRVVVMEKGKVIFSGKPCDVAETLEKINSSMFDALPTPARVYINVENSTNTPVEVKEGRAWLEEYVKGKGVTPLEIIQAENSNNESIIEVNDVYFRYEKNLPDVLKGLSLNVKKGEFYTILGGNGSGKTTTLSLIAGNNKPYRGQVNIRDKSIKVSMLPQNPQSLFIEKSVKAELCEALSDVKISEEKKEKKICEVISLCNLEDVLLRHPYDLSGGEAQRVALSKVLLTSPDIILLDEPTKGLDTHFKKKLASILLKLKKSGVTIIMVSHDVEFCAEYADRCALFFDGNIVSENVPREFFAGKNFYTTSANRMSRGLIENAVLADDIIYALTGKKNEKRYFEKKTDLTDFPEKEEKTPDVANERKNKKFRFMRSGLLSFLILAFLVPLTILTGKYLFDDREYYFISFIILLELSVPFFLKFEKRKPSARELVLISTLAALTAAGRIAFFMFPQFKPMTALIVITGVCLGAESGFLVGALSLFASNFFLSQGPWTPWQMFGFGFIGFLAGILGKLGIVRKNVGATVFGILAVLLVYAPIINFANVMMTFPKPTWELFKTSMIMGLPFDLIHAASTGLFLCVSFNAISEKIERLKNKYGIMKT